MSIEIRQLVVKSSVVSDQKDEPTDKPDTLENTCVSKALKKRLFDECKEWLTDQYPARGDR